MSRPRIRRPRPAPIAGARTRLRAAVCAALVLAGAWLGKLAAAESSAAPLAPMAGAGGAASEALGPPAPTSGWHESSLRVAGVERWYRTYLPAGLQPRAPVVLLLHGGTQSMRKLFAGRARGSQAWPEIAERERFLLLVPNGVDPRSGDAAGDRQHWNDLRPDGEAPYAAADDVGFIVALLERVAREHDVDRGRVYVTGASNGGMMAFRLLIEVPQHFAAGAAFIAALPAEDVPLAPPSVPTPLMIMNGTDDPLVPFGGGAVGRNRGSVRSTPDTVAWWVRANGLDARPVAEGTLPDVAPEDGCTIGWRQYGGEGEPRVLAYTMHGGGHAMPSLRYRAVPGPLMARLIGNPCGDVEGAELAWRFLSAFRR